MQQWFCGSGFFFADMAGPDIYRPVSRIDRRASGAAYVSDVIISFGDAYAGTNTKDRRIADNSKISCREKEKCASRCTLGK
jgi:hypothetical protein